MTEWISKAVKFGVVVMHQGLWNYVCETHHLYVILYPGINNSCSLCRRCHCKEPISTCKVLCFDNVRFSLEFMLKCGHRPQLHISLSQRVLAKMPKFHGRQENVSCSQRGRERGPHREQEIERTKACVYIVSTDNKAWEVLVSWMDTSERKCKVCVCVCGW